MDGDSSEKVEDELENVTRQDSYAGLYDALSRTI